MKRTLAVVAVGAGFAGGLATSPAWGDPGTGRPADPRCFGQEVVGFAQQYGGISSAAAAFGVSVQQGHNVVRGPEFCNRTSGFTPGR